MILPIYKITRMVPIKIGITGKRRDLPLKLIKTVFPLKGHLLNLPDGITIDTNIENEKLLFYYFHNLVRYYQKSPLFSYIRANLSGNDIFLDIGANLGFYSYLAKKICRCQVFLFEPEPGHLEFLKRNQHLFEKIYDVALSDKAGETDFYVGDGKNPGGSSLVMSAAGWEASGYSHTIKIRTQRLDKMELDPDLIRKIRLIKIDVEGAEKSVVTGMEGLLKEHTFDIWCEVRGDDSDRNPGSYRDICHYLEQFEYQPMIYDGKKLKTFNEGHVKQVFDILFRKKTRV